MRDPHCVTNHVATHSTIEEVASGDQKAPSQQLRDCAGCGRCEFRRRRPGVAGHPADAVSTAAAVGCSTSAADATANSAADALPATAGGASCDGARRAA